MRKEQIYLSTIASDAVRVAKEYGVNLEIAEYCTAWNMDEKFSAIDPVVRKKLTHSPRSLLHAPYNELFPCAIEGTGCRAVSPCHCSGEAIWQ